MKNALILLISCFVALNVNGQEKPNRLVFDFNLYRYSLTKRIVDYNETLKSRIFNTLKIGYVLKNDDVLKVGLGRFSEGIIYRDKRYQIFHATGNGNEVTISYEKRFTLVNNKLVFSLEPGLFYERYKEEGLFSLNSDSAIFQLNHIRKVRGALLELQASYQLQNNIEIYYSLRNRYGFYRSKPFGEQIYVWYPSFVGWKHDIEPLNLGFRLKI